jgi:hypothetical protein
MVPCDSNNLFTKLSNKRDGIQFCNSAMEVVPEEKKMLDI